MCSYYTKIQTHNGMFFLLLFFHIKFCSPCTALPIIIKHLGPRDVSSPCQEVQLPNEVKQQTVQCPDSIADEVSSLKGTYRGIVFGILNFLKEMVNNGKINLSDLAKTINESCKVEENSLTGNETVDDICFPITRNTNCFNSNLGLLLEIDAAFCKRQFRDDIRSYRTELRNFLNSTSVTTFKEKVMSQYENWNTSTSNSGEIIVTIEVSGYYGDATVCQIDYLKMFIFAEHSSDMVMQDIHHSVLTITYSMPAQFVLPVLSTVLKEINLLRIIGVLSIKIGDVLLPIGDEITEDDARMCDLEQRRKSKLKSIRLSVEIIIMQ